jgi:DNA polymerase-3 subunit gamma/tau
MDQFIVSARKYRPQTFDSVVGQKHITTTLKNAILQKQLAHAFLFCGPRGVGKTTCARILAKTINCENIQPNGEACDKCTSCISFNDGASLNIHELDAASNNTVDDIKTLIEQIRFLPQMGKYKVYIIDEVHMLSASAFNAFLKTLEEPPHYAIFILATTEKHKILPTILSRCQIFEFKRITTDDTVEHLQEIAQKESIEAEKSAMELIAQKSEGCMRDALSILDKIVSFTNGKITYSNTLEHLNILDADYFFRFIDDMKDENLSSVMLLFQEINHKGFEPELFLGGFAEFFRNLLVCKDAKIASLLETVENFKEKYKATASTTTSSFIISALNLLNEAEIQLKTARNKRLHTEITLIKLTYLQQALDQTGGGKKKLNESVKPVQFRGLNPIKIRQKEKDAALVENGRRQSENEKQPTLQIETPEVKEQKAPYTAAIKTEKPTSLSNQAAAVSIGNLAKIRARAKEKLLDIPDQKIIDEHNFKKVWDEFIVKLKSAEKNSTAANFEMMQYRIISQDQIIVTCKGDMQFGFFKQERNVLLDYLKNNFHHKTLTLDYEFIETPKDDTVAGPVLSTRDQYQQLTERYPAVKALKERLDMNLDY